MKLINHSTTEQLFERLRRMFGAAPAKTQSAALPWRIKKNSLEVMLITSRETGRWIVPKGWPEPDEPLAECAKREAFEEAGIRGRIDEEPLGSFFYDKTASDGMVTRCEVHLFAMEVVESEKRWPEKSERNRRWLTPEDAAGRVAEPALSEMIFDFGTRLRASAA